MFPVTKSNQTPSSLMEKRSYREKDVIDALSRDFYGKCYICEIKHPISFNVEHFRPHKNDPEKIFDWNNLYFSCSRCNNMKGSKYTNILDCTNPNIDVLMAVKHVFPSLHHSTHAPIIPMYDNEETKQTAELISKVFNDIQTGNKELSRLNLRRRLMNRYRKFLELILDYEDDDTLPEEKHFIRRKIRNMLDVSYEFSAFFRWAIIDSPKLHHLREGIF